jgi:hypothetical protein
MFSNASTKRGRIRQTRICWFSSILGDNMACAEMADAASRPDHILTVVSQPTWIDSAHEEALDEH